MRCLFLILFALCSLSEAQAAVGTSWPQVWYVRPASICPINGDGLSYGCALSKGGPGAFSDPAGVRWNAVTGVDDGDTLYVCGAHTNQLSTVASGAASSPITIDGNCPGDQGSINTAGRSNVDSAILFTDSNHFVVQGFNAGGMKGLTGNRSAILMFAYKGVMDNFLITRNLIDNRTSASSTNVCNGIMADGRYAHTNVVITYNTILGTARTCGGTSNSDAINLIRLTSGLIAWNDVSGSEGGIDLDGTMEGVDIYGNWSHDNRVDGMKAFGGNACSIGPLRVQQNLFVNNGNWGAIWQSQQHGVFADNIIIQFRDSPQNGHAPYGGLQIENPPPFSGPLCHLIDNTYIGNIITADWQYGVMTNFSENRVDFETNNRWHGNLVYQRGTQAPLIWFGTPLAPTSHVNAGNYAAWQSAHPGDINATPQFVDATDCTSPATSAACQAADFRLASASTFKNAGIGWGLECVGVNGVACAMRFR